MSWIYTHPGQPQMQVEVILASRSTVPGAPVIYTIRMRYPRIIHAELMTHRVFSRNARSSRAVPVKTMLLETTSIPFIPWHWGANQKGMQAGAECNEPVLIPDWDDVNFHGNPPLRSHDRVEAWLLARDKSVEIAEAMMNAGYHKQIPNRLLEPFAWIDTLVTSTEWENFLWLRDHKDAEPHLQDLARLVKQAIDEAPVQTLEPGQWHLPYITDADRHALLVESGRLAGDRYIEISGVDDHNEWLRRISSARCARISYKPFDGDPSYERELERYNSLVKSDRVHASPLEHQATPDFQINRWTYMEAHPSLPEEQTLWAYPELSGNLGPGWVQYRKMVSGENHTG